MFKNVTAFKFNKLPDMANLELEDSLARMEFAPTSPTQKVRAGWVSPLGREAKALSHTVNRRTLMSMKVQTRTVPADALKEAFDVAVRKIETDEARKLSNRDKKELREDLELDLLPRVFPKNKIVKVWIDEPNKWLLIDTPTVSVAEDACTLLRKSFGTLAVEPIDDGSLHVVSAMSRWVDERTAPEPFVLGHGCTFKDSEADSTAIFKKALITADEVVDVKREGGMHVSELELCFVDNHDSFRLNENMQIKNLSLGEEALSEVTDLDCQTHEEHVDAEFVLYSSVVATILTHLLEVLS